MWYMFIKLWSRWEYSVLSTGTFLYISYSFLLISYKFWIGGRVGGSSAVMLLYRTLTLISFFFSVSVRIV
jgi:hypothetical protein